MTLLKPDLPERFGREQYALAEVNMLRRQLHAEPARPTEYRLEYEYGEVLPSPPGLHADMIWVADSGRFEWGFTVGELAVRAVHHLRDLGHGERLWVRLEDETLVEQGLRMPSPWVCIDSEERDYAIWKHTGALYTSSYGEVAEDPIWEPSGA